MNNVTATIAAPIAWQQEFCDRYALLMLAYGRWFLLAALLIGAAGAIVLVWRTLYPAPPAVGVLAAPGDPAGLQTIIEAIKGLVEAFAKAPTWLAMFGGGILLIWMAGNALPDFCIRQPPAAPNRQAGNNATQQNGQGNVAGNTVANAQGAGTSGR